MPRSVPRATPDIPTEPAAVAERATPFVEFLDVCKSYDGDTLAVAHLAASNGTASPNPSRE